MVGHNNPSVTAAVQEQAGKVMHTSSLCLSEPMIALAEQIAELSGIPNARVFMTPSGTEANDTAILLATSYRKSNQMLAMRNSYHGRSFTSQAITSHSSWSSTSLSGLKVTFVHGPYKLRSPFKIEKNAWGNGTALFTRDGGAARRFQHEVEAGMVGINVPVPVPVGYHSFGGWNDSFFGDTTMYGPEGMRFYTRPKVTTTRWPDPSISSVNLGFPTND